MTHRARTIGPLLALVLAGSGCASAPENSPAPQGAPAQQLSYVALGDSYASMGTRQGPHSGPRWCERATDNYPTKLQELTGMQLNDQTCQGALTDHVLGPREDLPPQIDAVDSTTDVVTLSIGGNDAGFGVLTSCAMNTSGLNCAELHGVEIDAALAALPAKLDGVYRELERRAPRAKVFATGYMPLLADADTGATCPEIAKVSDVDRLWFTLKISQINVEVEKAALRAGAQYVMPPEIEKHTGCAPADQRWVDLAGTETGAFPMHPTPLGQEEMAKTIAAYL
ncbi:SGNH/GDSL hydrolase family protein [Corynebacterium striatum]|uniref:SGNH/GDSL hydrolase family protein n=1 Tax=Corynebacterium striatum TaxID=43770 RepID=A0ABC8CGN8_CORST|nr:SGNH/GDSL hydrolase family protein [Corynebacterium striatum]ATZ07617.1 SGNH/GDSL hydrolase family protein [Corynebacterium striatum]EGT5612266.1 SGNH/GDSL hydrolase family protein [Corynebacterium striatum]MDK8825155.1 SGNH/GDSL hydrolase family protein [Corynebacterium striatum]NHY10603.1 SGNH/GDSL hydrolase family protein [Corynebacterium striatum]NHY34930.1 SGNH/GDSL hydrolase family protein [Corynebacterium striatum]